MRILIAFSLVLTVAGCAAPGVEESFDDVRTLSGAGGDDLVWRRSAEADRAAEARVAALLAEPLTMAGVVEIALINNPDLQARFEDIGIARAAVVAAGRPHNPVLEAATRFPEGGGALEIDLGLTTSLFDIFLIPARTRVATAAFEARKYAVADAVRVLAHEARRLAIRYEAARASREAAGERRAVADAALSYARSLHKAGNLTDLALADYEVADMEAVLEQETAGLNLELAAAALNRVMGLSASPHWQWGEDMSLENIRPIHIDEPSLRQLVVSAGEKRLDLTAQRHRIDQLAEARGIAVSWSGIDEIEGGVQAERSDGWAIGPSLAVSLPLFHQGQAEVARSDAELRQARRAYEAMAGGLVEEVRGALERVRGAATRAQYYNTKLLPLYQRAIGLAQRNYNFMIDGAFELLDRKRREVEARQAYLEACTDYRLALADLERALGGPVPEDLFASMAAPLDEPASGHHHHHSEGE